MSKFSELRMCRRRGRRGLHHRPGCDDAAETPQPKEKKRKAADTDTSAKKQVASLKRELASVKKELASVKKSAQA